MPEYRVRVPVVFEIEVSLDPDFFPRVDREYAEIVAASRVGALVEALEGISRVMGDSISVSVGPDRRASS